MDMKKFIKDRNEAFFSLDKRKIEAYCKKYEIPLEQVPDEVFWIGVHKGITAIKDAPPDIRERSIKWLTSRGYQHF